MKKHLLLFRLLPTVLFLFYAEVACSQGTWIRKADFPLPQKDGAVSFTINNMVYVVTGSFTKDVWQYNPLSNIWTKKNDFPGVRRSNAFGFSIGNKGYLGTGETDSLPTDNSCSYYLPQDFWEYDASADSWVRKSNFAAGQRYSATAFSANGKGYVMGGDHVKGNAGICQSASITVTSDFWEYDPITNQWLQKTAFPGGRRKSACSFVVNNMGYVGTGYIPFNLNVAGTAISYNDLYMYNTTNGTWTKKSNFPGGGRFGMSAFAFDSTGYFCLGAIYVSINTSAKKDLWAYDTNNDVWKQELDFGGVARTNAIAASVNGKAYVGLPTKDFWEYTPTNPVSFVSYLLFSGKVLNANAVQLSWTTATEQNNYGFDVQQSADSINFNTIGFVPSNTPDGNSSTPSNYVFKDVGPLPGKSYYRLRTTDKDQHSLYSTVIIVAMPPAIILSFSGNLFGGNAVQLAWQTSIEKSNAGFTVQRSADSLSFNDIGKVASKAQGGNGTAPNNYGFEDDTLLIGNNYYRLKITDSSGQFWYSNVIVVATPSAILISFTGSLLNGTAQLKWKTTAELNNSGFELQWSANRSTFGDVGFVPSVAPNGISHTVNSYTLIDAKPLVGNNFYRLKIIGNSGQYWFSDLVNVPMAAPPLPSLQILTLSPNPCKNILVASFDTPIASTGKLIIVNSTGSIVVNQDCNIIAGSNSYYISVNLFSAGLYFVKFISIIGEMIFSGKFIKD